jgi:hypothetical protein
MFRISVWVCVCVLIVSCALPVAAQSWSALNSKASFNANTALLLTDGTVMVQAYSTSNWWRLTPDSTGSYINGSWTKVASLPSNYGPLYYASAVLPDDRLDGAARGWHSRHNGMVGGKFVEVNLAAVAR